MKIAIGFYGITRSLGSTINSIRENIIDPCRNYADTQVFAHFYNQKNIENPRTLESGQLDQNEWKLLSSDFCKIDEIGESEELELCAEVRKFGNAWEDGGQSTANLIRQLLSLKRLTNNIYDIDKYDIIIYVRPDMFYHDPIPIASLQNSIMKNSIFLPGWAFGGGVNDRFSVCGSTAALVFGNRIDFALSYCRKYKSPLQSERFLLYQLAVNKIIIKFFDIRATRIRSNGIWSDEYFGTGNSIKKVDVKIKSIIARLL
jgi:hypothetical protein